MPPFDSRSQEEAEGSVPFPRPLLRLEVLDLSIPGSVAFLRAINADQGLQAAVKTVLETLYPRSTQVDAAAKDESGYDSKLRTSAPTHAGAPWPGTRSVTLIVDPYNDGVAFTTGKTIDQDHKEIHLMTSYVEAIPAGRLTAELDGVLVHEMVHCWQWAANGTVNGGLLEGIADFVRLKAGLAPPHWKRRHGKDDSWDSGYAITAYFLDWLEGKFGKGTIVGINSALRHLDKFDEDDFFQKVVGRKVGSLWHEYTTDGPGKWDESN